MSYLTHLQQMSNEKTFARKIDYLKHNFSSLIKNNSKDFSVLELGPGLGEGVSYLNSLGIKDIDIIDNDLDILNYLRKKFKINKALQFKSLKTTEKKLRKYNLILLIQVLEHLPVNIYPEVIMVLYSHLKPGGDLVIVVPNGNNPLGLVERYSDIQHTSSFTQQSLKDLVNVSKIKNYHMEIKGFEIPPFSIVNIIRIILQKILHLLILVILIINGGLFYKTLTPNITLVIKKIK